MLWRSLGGDGEMEIRYGQNTFVYIYVKLSNNNVFKFLRKRK